MNDPEKTRAPRRAAHSPARGQGREEEPPLLVLALLEQLRSDRAQGRVFDLSDYYAANPELEDVFLAMVLATDRDDERVETSSNPQESSISDHQPLSPGVLRALASIPEFSEDLTRAVDRRVAESRAPYDVIDH
jgi:hypothetical protein